MEIEIKQGGEREVYFGGKVVSGRFIGNINIVAFV
jgi:hypothetical protein